MNETQLPMIRVLFLSAWYPHRYDSMFGLFVKKHAEAVSRYCEVNVLFVLCVKNITKVDFVRTKHNDNFYELIIYFPSKNGIFGSLLNFLYYMVYCFRGLHITFKERGKPDIIHANILNRSAFPALILKFLKRIPYVVSEHWSRYLPVNSAAFKGICRKTFVRLIVRNASTVMPVSMVLKDAMLRHKLNNENYEIVHNVVDDFFFESFINQKDKSRKKNIIHISCFYEHAKNISGILRTASKLCKVRNDFRLILIGTGDDFRMLNTYANQLGFPDDTLIFTGEQSPEQVVEHIRNSDFMVLFSNFETAGIVIAESLICGKPVISTKVGSATEIIDDKTGILIDVANESQLLEAMNKMLNTINSYDAKIIKSKVEAKFDYKNVGNQIHKIYQIAIQS